MPGIVNSTLMKKLSGFVGKAFEQTQRIRGAFATGAKSAKENVAGMRAQGMPLDEALKATKESSRAYRAGSKMFQYGQSAKATNSGAWKAVKGLGWAMSLPAKMGMGVAKTALRHPKTTGLALGATAGMGSRLAAIADERTSNLRRPGMKANNLGTDGLTLSLHKSRHR